MLEIRRKSIAKAQMRLRTSCRRFLISNGSLNSSGAVCPIPTSSFQFSLPPSRHSDTFLFSVQLSDTRDIRSETRALYECVLNCVARVSRVTCASYALCVFCVALLVGRFVSLCCPRQLHLEMAAIPFH